jgi:hypothetical protein
MSTTTQQSDTYVALVRDIGGFAAPLNNLLRQKATTYAPQLAPQIQAVFDAAT